MKNSDKAIYKSLDRIDRMILQNLQQDGRISNVELSRRVHLSPSPCLERVKQLESSGYIEGYGARISAERLGQGMYAFIQITLDRTTADVFDRFREAVVEIPEVAECHMVAGGFDYLLKLRVSDIGAYRKLLGELVELPGISQTHTYMVIEDIKQDSGIVI